MSNEIEAETIRHLAKVRKPVSPEPIQLTVYSSKVPNLTLVDMPGQLPCHRSHQPSGTIDKCGTCCHRPSGLPGMGHVQ